jgi:hypothetical protein
MLLSFKKLSQSQLEHFNYFITTVLYCNKSFGFVLLFFGLCLLNFLRNKCIYFGRKLAYYCGQKKWDINVIVLTFNVK